MRTKYELVTAAKVWFYEELDRFYGENIENSDPIDITEFWKKIIKIRRKDIRFGDALATVFFCGTWDYDISKHGLFYVPSTKECIESLDMIRVYLRGHCKKLKIQPNIIDSWAASQGYDVRDSVNWDGDDIDTYRHRFKRYPWKHGWK